METLIELFWITAVQVVHHPNQMLVICVVCGNFGSEHEARHDCLLSEVSVKYTYRSLVNRERLEQSESRVHLSSFLWLSADGNSEGTGSPRRVTPVCDRNHLCR